ncbi:MAG TPA: phage holin family protein [Chitinophagaceae bacterium]|nr:phage holin family protein [Chitinophagaceae bacterium]
METEQIKDKVGNITDHAGDYLDTLVKVSLLKITRKATDIVSGAMSILVACVLGMFILFFGGFAAAWWLGDVMASRAGGFLVVALFCFVVTIVVILLRKKIVFPFIRNVLTRKMHE